MSKGIIYTARFEARQVQIAPAAVRRYLGMGRQMPEAGLQELIARCIAEFEQAARYRACWMTLDISVGKEGVDFGAFCAPGESIARNLRDCGQAILFAATVGAETELQRKRAAVSSPARALVLDAVGTAAVEACCDLLCRQWQQELEPSGQFLRPRFSPGYGDLPLELQRQLLQCLDSSRKAGISLSESLLMIPQKSVSGIVGIGASGCFSGMHDCENCDKRDCAFRL